MNGQEQVIGGGVFKCTSSSGTISCGICIDIRCSIMGDKFSCKRSSGKCRSLSGSSRSCGCGERAIRGESILLYHHGSHVAKSCIVHRISTAKSSVLGPVR
jgi:hypothetical protein